MLTDKEFQRLKDQIKKLLQTEFRLLHEDLKHVGKDAKENTVELKRIHEKLDEFISIMKHFSKEQKILKKKMEAIEKHKSVETLARVTYQAWRGQ